MKFNSIAIAFIRLLLNYFFLLPFLLKKIISFTFNNAIIIVKEFYLLT